MTRLSAVVLAAGAGTRMRSTRPKPLHLLCGRTMVGYVLDSLSELKVDRAVIVVGHGAEAVQKKLLEDGGDLRLEFVEQTVQRGSGDAAMVGLTGLADDDDDDEVVIVLPGDTPLLRPATITALLALHRESEVAATVLTAVLDDPHGYGRIVRGKDGNVARIVEQSDASPEEIEITEINTGIFCFRRTVLGPALRRIDTANAQGEYYLTDVIEVLADMGYPVTSMVAADAGETPGVNDRRQLATAEAELRRRTNLDWMARGVTMVDPAHTYLDAAVELAEDVTLFPGTMLQGHTVVGPRAEIGPNTHLIDCSVGSDAVVRHSVGTRATIGADAQVGPFVALEPGATVAVGARLGPPYNSD